MRFALDIVIIAIIFVTLAVIKSFVKGEFINILVTITSTLLILALITNPAICIKEAIYGAELFFHKVFPTMFSFIILTNIIIYYDGIYIYSKLFGRILCKPLRLPTQCSIALIVSMLCGYPLGAKYSCELYEKKKIDYKTTLRLINIASNCSPLFIMGTLGTSMLNSSVCGYILLFSSYLSCFIMGLILPGGTSKNSEIENYTHKLQKQNLGEVLKNSIENSIASSTLVFGFVVMYSVIIGIIKNTAVFTAVNNNKVVESIFFGLLEITNGCSFVTSSSLNIELKLILLSFFISFSGLCIISQVYAFTSVYKFPISYYVINKFFQGIISSSITLLLFKLNNSAIYTWNQNSIDNGFSITPVLFIIFFLPFILYKIYNLDKEI